MAMFDIRCPKCGGFAQSSNLTCSKSNVQCTRCGAKFDVKVTSDSSKTGRYTTSNIQLNKGGRKNRIYRRFIQCGKSNTKEI